MLAQPAFLSWLATLGSLPRVARQNIILRIWVQGPSRRLPAGTGVPKPRKCWGIHQPGEFLGNCRSISCLAIGRIHLELLLALLVLPDDFLVLMEVWHGMFRASLDPMNPKTNIIAHIASLNPKP